MHYEADAAKADANLAKHGVAFDEAATCLLDPMALVMEDDAQDEVRCVLVGTSERGRVLTVVYTMRGDVPRLISARKATAREKASYED
jgi:Uncharacterized protein conserved in bacteria